MSRNFSVSVKSFLNLLQTKFPTPNYGIHTFSAFNQSSQNHVKTHQTDLMARGLPKKKKIDGVKHVLLVASAKGGVGKSTTAVNIAVALKNEDPSKQVGLLDADVFGPSIPLMMNLHESPLLNKENLMIPLQNYGVKCMSMGFLVDKDSPVIWRGLMVMQALDRLLRQVSWDPVDYLVIDSPPGTGDTHLSLIQNIPLSGALLVTTPQTAALQVTQRGANMFKKLNIPILGIIQNMSSVECPKCHYEVCLHSSSANVLVQNLGVPVLADIPLDDEISRGSDNGIPVSVALPQSRQAKSYKMAAQKIIEFLNNKENESVTNKS